MVERIQNTVNSVKSAFYTLSHDVLDGVRSSMPE